MDLVLFWRKFTNFNVVHTEKTKVSEKPYGPVWCTWLKNIGLDWILIFYLRWNFKRLDNVNPGFSYPHWSMGLSYILPRPTVSKGQKCYWAGLSLYCFCQSPRLSFYVGKENACIRCCRLFFVLFCFFFFFGKLWVGYSKLFSVLNFVWYILN